jgi:hypothetical protein
VFNIGAKPFAWRGREVKGGELRNILNNFCNYALETPLRAVRLTPVGTRACRTDRPSAHGLPTQLKIQPGTCRLNRSSDRRLVGAGK